MKDNRLIKENELTHIPSELIPNIANIVTAVMLGLASLIMFLMSKTHMTAEEWTNSDVRANGSIVLGTYFALVLINSFSLFLKIHRKNKYNAQNIVHCPK